MIYLLIDVNQMLFSLRYTYHPNNGNYKKLCTSKIEINFSLSIIMKFYNIKYTYDLH